jgi:hypothetical protein
MARVQVVGVRAAGPTAGANAAPVPAYVEPHPEAIAKLIALVRQTERALLAANAIAKDSSAVTVLDEVDEVLWAAFGVAVHEASDRAVPAEMAGRLAAVPARMRALEASLVTSGAAEVPMVVDVHSDRASTRALEQAVGRLEELWQVVREPETHRLVLAVGASIPHFELVRPMAARTSDTVWRARLTSEGDPSPGPLEQAYLVKP